MRFNRGVGLCMLRAIRNQGHEKSNGRMVGHIRSGLRQGLRIFCHTRRSKYFSLV